MLYIFNIKICYICLHESAACLPSPRRLAGTGTFYRYGFIERGTMFCSTLKLKEVLNKQILSASVPEAAVLI